MKTGNHNLGKDGVSIIAELSVNFAMISNLANTFDLVLLQDFLIIY